MENLRRQLAKSNQRNNEMKKEINDMRRQNEEAKCMRAHYERRARNERDENEKRMRELKVNKNFQLNIYISRTTMFRYFDQTFHLSK